MSPEKNFDAAARHCMVALGAAFLIFLGGCVTYASGASVLWAWGGLVLFAAFATAGAILLALIAHEAGGMIAKLERKAQPAGALRRVLVTIGTSNPPPEPEGEGHPLAVKGYQLLAHADLAVNVNLDERRGMVEKYRYDRTDGIGVDVAVVKVGAPK